MTKTFPEKKKCSRQRIDRVWQAIVNLLPSKSYSRRLSQSLFILWNNLEYSYNANNYDMEIQSLSIFRRNDCIFISSDEHCASEILSMQLFLANLYQNLFLKNEVFLYLGLNVHMFILLYVYICFYTHMHKSFNSFITSTVYIYIQTIQKAYTIHKNIICVYKSLNRAI